MFRDFKWHLEQEFAKKHNVTHYASLLSVSPQRLSDVCRLSAGVSAKTMISERVILEAKRYLCYSKLLVSEIAARVGYQDPLYFSRVFKQHAGMSPRAFRASLTHRRRAGRRPHDVAEPALVITPCLPPDFPFPRRLPARTSSPPGTCTVVRAALLSLESRA